VREDLGSLKTEIALNQSIFLPLSHDQGITYGEHAIYRRAFLASARGAAQSLSPTDVFADPSAFACDLALFERIFETLHPGLWPYQLSEDFQGECSALKAAL